MDWTVFLALASIAIAALAAIRQTLDKSLSIREHEVFKNNSEENLKLVRMEFSQYRDDIRRQLKRLHKELDAVTATRPTTGELQGVSNALAARVDAIVKLMAAQNGKG